MTAYLATQLVALEEQDLALRGGGEHGVHGLRVAARRLRSALATYAPLFQPDATTRLRSELRWLGAVMAGARDAQVLRQRLTALVDEQPAELVLGRVSTRLDESLRRRYAAGRAVADEALDSERYVGLLDRLQEFLDDPPFTGDARRPAREVTPGLLEKDLERVHERHERYQRARSEPERDVALHEVRKASKRLRYAAETTLPVFGSQAARLASRAEAVQELLGDHQDTVVSRTVLREIGGAGVPGRRGRVHLRPAARSRGGPGRAARARPPRRAGEAASLGPALLAEPLSAIRRTAVASVSVASGGRGAPAAPDHRTMDVLRSISLFLLAAVAEIGGAWLVWQGVRENRGWLWIGLGVVALGLYGFVATLQPDANFGRILAAYGGVFVAGSLVWGMVLDGFRPDRYDVVGALVCLVGVAVIMYAPRSALSPPLAHRT